MNERKRRPGPGGASKTKNTRARKYNRLRVFAQKKTTIAKLAFARDLCAPWRSR